MVAHELNSSYRILLEQEDQRNEEGDSNGHSCQRKLLEKPEHHLMMSRHHDVTL